MLENGLSREAYYALNRCLEQQNREYLDALSTKEYRIGSAYTRFVRCVKTGNWKSVRGYFRNRRWEKEAPALSNAQVRREAVVYSADDYFTTQRIAVYTCVFGNYDRLQEPLFHPDNIDYFIITDQEVPADSLWRPVPWEAVCPESLSNAEKNRFFKMHPETVFGDYQYSIYLDGNIRVISDLTPFISRLGKSGLGFHFHNQRGCAYEELKAVQLAHKAKKDDADAYCAYLEAQQFPRNYGLLECNVIVREHHNPVCRKVMSDWWSQFLHQIHRDQVSLPYVLCLNGISVEEVAVLGPDVYRNYALRVVRHV